MRSANVPSSYPEMYFATRRGGGRLVLLRRPVPASAFPLLLGRRKRPRPYGRERHPFLAPGCKACLGQRIVPYYRCRRIRSSASVGSVDLPGL